MRWHGIYCCLAVCLLALVLAGPHAALANDDTRSAQAAARLDNLRDKIAAMRQQIAGDKSQRSDLANALATAEARVSAARQHLRALDDTIAEHKKRIASLTARRDAERADLGDQLDRLRAQVRAAYENGRMNKIRLLLSDQSPEKLGRLLVYFEYFADAQTRQVAALRDTLSDLAIRQRALEKEQTRLARQRETRANALAQLKDHQQQRRRTIGALDKRLASRTASLDEMRDNKQRLQRLIGRLREQVTQAAPPAPDTDTPIGRLKGRLQPPVQGPVLARFHSLKAGGPLRWQGQWRGAKPGTPVRAVADGRVVYVGYMHRYGLIVIVDHGHDYYTLYGHAQSSYVVVGDHVERGQPVAKAGRSGGHRRAGAYFELRKGDTPINPARWLAGS